MGKIELKGLRSQASQLTLKPNGKEKSTARLSMMYVPFTLAEELINTESEHFKMFRA